MRPDGFFLGQRRVFWDEHAPHVFIGKFERFVVISFSVFFTKSKISSARLRKIMPSLVRVIFREPLEPRIRSCFPGF